MVSYTHGDVMARTKQRAHATKPGWGDDAPGNAELVKRRTARPARAERDTPERTWVRPMRGDFIPMISPHWLFKAIDLGKPATRLALLLCWHAAKNKYQPITLRRSRLMAWGITNRKLSAVLKSMERLITVTPGRDQMVTITFMLPKAFRKVLTRKKNSASTPDEAD